VQGDDGCAVARSVGHDTTGAVNVQGRCACGWGGLMKEGPCHGGAGDGRGECVWVVLAALGRGQERTRKQGREEWWWCSRASQQVGKEGSQSRAGDNLGLRRMMAEAKWDCTNPCLPREAACEAT
jgi:hypothetical protein